MDSADHWEGPIWRLRFKAYSPLELDDWLKRCPDGFISDIAREVLDEKIAARVAEA